MPESLSTLSQGDIVLEERQQKTKKQQHLGSKNSLEARQNAKGDEGGRSREYKNTS